MAFEIPVFDISLQAGADLSAYQHRFVKVASTSLVASLAGSNDIAIGVLQDKPLQGHMTQVRVYGISKVVAGAAIAAGAGITVDAQGRAITHTSGALYGVALDGATAEGSIVSVLLLTRGEVTVPDPEPVEPINELKFEAGADLTDKEGLFAVLDAGEVVVAGAGARAIGVITEGAKADEEVTIAAFGIVEVLTGAGVTGANITVGDAIASDAAGKAVVAAEAVDPGTVVLGTALDASDTADKTIRILLQMHGAALVSN